LGRTYLVKHTVRQTKIRALRIRHRVNINTLAEEPATRLEMNEIGSVEFETHVPLFFDPYSSNRTTGSFILIDAVTNATVGAGMIQEDAPAKAIAEEEKFSSSGVLETPVAAEERYARHGHFPAVLLVEGRPDLAVRLERLLFERGFEVLHLSRPEFSADAIADTVRLTQKAGIIVLYSGEALAGETKHHLATEFSDRLFDLSSAPELHGNDELVARHVLARAESLWLVDEPRKNRGRVN
jgi:bifunctional enzyme CysN/CysC/sulfate adenylyltransferase subunit 1